MMELTRSGGGGGADIVTIDAYAMRNVAACINFSCDPNLDFYPVGTPHGDRAYPRVGFFARRTINKGDELGYQRDKNSFSMRSKRENGKKCECGAKGCCGWV